MLISRDVIVDEVASWNWVNESKTNVPCFLEVSVKILGKNTTKLLTVRSYQRVRFSSTRLVDHELFSDNIVVDNGELVNLAFLNQKLEASY